LGIENTVAFDAERLTTLGASDFVKDVIKSVVIHGFEFDEALKESRTMHCQALGKQTNFLHFSRTFVDKYTWAHRNIQPWGQRLLTQCPQCGILNPWMKPVHVKEGGPAYYATCKNPNCVEPGGRGQRFKIKVERPENSDFSNCGNDAGWLRLRIASD
jgi:hypothetical protein